MIYDHVAGEYQYYSYASCTSAVVVSVANPISGGFTFYLNDLGTGTAYTSPENLPNTQAALDFDNRLLARAVKIDPIELPEGASPADDESALSAYIYDVLVPTGLPAGQSWTHFFSNLPDLQLTYLTFVDSRTGETERVFIGGTIKVVFPDGKTMLVEFLGTSWKAVDGSVRNPDGSIPGATSSGSEQETASIDFNFDYGDHFEGFDVVPIFHSPGTRIDRAGVVTIVQLGADRTFTYER